MIRRLEDFSCKDRLREIKLFSLEKGRLQRDFRAPKVPKGGQQKSR